MTLQRSTAALFVVGTLSAGLVGLTSPAAGSAKGCSGYADSLRRAKSFWTRAGVEQVKSCAAQFGTGPGSGHRRLTPLHLATVFSGDPAAVAALLESGADPDAKTRISGFTSLHMAAQYTRNPAIVAELLKGGAKIDARTKKGSTPLRIAAEHRSDAVVVEMLLKGGADPNSRLKGGTTPLHGAAQYSSNPAIVARLLKGGADPSSKNQEGSTPLHYAAQHNSNPAIVAELVKAGAEPDARSKQGATPLHMAALFNSEPAVALALLRAGADPNAQGKGKVRATPLHLAAYRNGNPAVVMALLDNGADPTVIVDGYAAFDLAGKNKKLAGTAAYGRLRDAHNASQAERPEVPRNAHEKSETQGTDKAEGESVSWRGDCSLGKELKHGEGCRIPGGGEFKVASDGCVRALPNIPRGPSNEKVTLSMGQFSVSKGRKCFRGNLRYGKFAATEKAETSSWRIEALP